MGVRAHPKGLGYVPGGNLRQGNLGPAIRAHVAAAQGQAEMVKFLASKGANLNDHGKINQWERKIIAEPRPKDLNKGGFTALHYAAREGCAACVANLLAAGP